MNRIDILYDRRWIGNHGIGRYAAELEKRLPALEQIPLAGKPASITDPFRMHFQLRRLRPGCYLTPGFNAVWRPSCPVLLTIHDLIPVVCPESKSAAKSAYFYALQRPLIRSSPVTFTVSEFSKQEILRCAKVASEKVCVTGNGISSDFTPHGAAANHPRRYVLYVGNPKPHKNVDFLLRSLARIADVEDFDLVAVCREDDRLSKLCAQLGFAERVHWRSGLSDIELAELYRGAQCLIMPSLYEGFGLPIVEAMACGCPVLCADRTSLPEVAGDAGILFDPRSEDSLIEATRAVLRSSIDLAALRQAGLTRSAVYSWDTVGRRVREALHQHSFLDSPS